MNRTLQVTGACLLVFAPILFAGLIFAALFKRTAEPDRAFGFNIAGAMIGGLAEYSSMLLGFQYVVLVAILFYALSGLGPIQVGPADSAETFVPQLVARRATATPDALALKVAASQ